MIASLVRFIVGEKREGAEPARPVSPAVTTTTAFITGNGAALAFGAGVFLGFGIVLLEAAPSARNVRIIEKLARKGVGGGMLVLGLYMFSPTVLRQLWLAAI